MKTVNGNATIGYVVVPTTCSGEPIEPVRISRLGSLVSTNEGSWCFGRRGETWPTIYRTEEAALRSAERHQQACKHDWRVLSHEESRCYRCGAVAFIPDVD